MSVAFFGAMCRPRDVLNVAALCLGFGLGCLLTVPPVSAFGMLPGLALPSPINGSNVSGTVTLEAAADSGGLVSLQFPVDGSNYGSQITAGACRAAFDTKTAPDGPHTIQAVAQDEFGNTVVSPPATIIVNNLVPAISGLAATNVTASSATIGWTTLVAADSQVEYGVTSSYGSASLPDYGFVLNHALTLTGLAAGTTYHLRALSTGQNGIVSSSGDFVFTTAVMPTPTPTPTPSPGVWTRSRGRRPAPIPTPTPTPTPAAPAVSLSAKHQIWSSWTRRWVCDATVSATAPDATAGWRAQFQVDGVNLGRRDSTAPYRVTGMVSVGAHQFRLVWSRMGQPSLTSATVAAECR